MGFRGLRRGPSWFVVSLFVFKMESRVIACLLSQVEQLKKDNAKLRARAKPVLALDVDEVLAEFLPALIRFHNAKYGTVLHLKDFHSYWFCKVWGGTNEEATEKVHAFFESEYFKKIEPVPGAKEAITKLKQKYDLCIVTSRQHIIAEATMQWLDMYFGLEHMFADSSVPVDKRVMFGNHWSRECPDPTKINATKRSKSAMCKEVGAIALVDDSADYAKECGKELNRVCLFGNYGWNALPEAEETALPSSVRRTRNWDDVLKLLL